MCGASLLAGGGRLGAQAAAPDAPYVVRGHQAEVHQRALKDRADRFHSMLLDVLRRAAPDLMRRLDPPPPIAYGYQLLPRVTPDAPPKPPAKPQVVRYSWGWSETLIAREMATLDRLERDLARVSGQPAVA